VSGMLNLKAYHVWVHFGTVLRVLLNGCLMSNGGPTMKPEICPGCGGPVYWHTDGLPYCTNKGCPDEGGLSMYMDDDERAQP